MKTAERSMLGVDAIVMLYHCAKVSVGDILEVGSYVGGATIAMAMGVRDSGTEKKIQRESEWREHCNRTPECFSRKLEIRPTGKPPCQGCNWDDEQSQAPGISERRRIIRGGLQNCRMNDCSQCNGSGNNERRCDGKYDVKRFFVLLHDDNSVNRTVLSFKI
ncbi:MAG TPA: hypothetical protein VM260_18055 [Pirellula sp.]|nr:hypothetical protein [Pirellula sp.]